MSGLFINYRCPRCHRVDSHFVRPAHVNQFLDVDAKCGDCLDVLLNTRAEMRRAPGDDRLTIDLPTRAEYVAYEHNRRTVTTLADRVRRVS